MSDEIREQLRKDFETKYPPKPFYRDGNRYHFHDTFGEQQEALKIYNARWHSWQAAHEMYAPKERIVEMETVLRMIKDNDIVRFMQTGEHGNGELVRAEIDRVLAATETGAG